MARMVKCVKLGKELPGLERKPFSLKGELGDRVFENVSAEGWKMWQEHAKMLVNEYRLDLSDPRSREMLNEQLERYFFGEGAALPAEYVPPKSK